LISSPMEAEVFLDGRSVGSTAEPLRVESVSPAVHTVRFEKKGYRTWQKADVLVRNAETTTVLAALVPERDYSWVRLFSDPAGARVWLDGNDVGVTTEAGLAFKASKGVHSLRLEADPVASPGFEPLRAAVNFSEDEIDYRDRPLRLPPVDGNFTNALRLIERGQREEALTFLDRVPPDHPSFGEARIRVVEVLRGLGRVAEIPRELQTLVSRPENRNNPVLNTALGYWSLMAARDAGGKDAVRILGRATEALDRAIQSPGPSPPGDRGALLLKACYYSGIANEILFHLTGEKKYVKKGGHAWEVFFARLELTPDSLQKNWVEKARTHRRSLEFLETKLGG